MDLDGTAGVYEAKLIPPIPMVSLVDRANLGAELDNCADGRICLVVAPPGYGKSTLLSQWARGRKKQKGVVGWLSLDEGDRDPSQFLTCMILSLTAAGANLGDLEKSAKQGLEEVPLNAALSSFLVEIGRQKQPVTLILDDYHRAEGKAVNAVVDFIAERAPLSFHLVISSRERPALALASLKAQGLVREVCADHLRFTPPDASHIFEGLLGEADVASLVARTEGWAVALQLARLWLSDDVSRVSEIERFSGRMADMADYLAEQVFSALPDEVQDFLLHTSILERVNGDLANAVTGRTDCWELLGELEKLNVLLVPLDGERRWYRYHLLFREYLEDQLRRRSTDKVRELHLIASQWFEEHHDLVAAARHARLSEDHDRVARIIEDAGGWQMVILGGAGRARAFLLDLPHELLFAYPRLGLARAYLHIKDGEIAEARALVDRLVEHTDQFESVIRNARDVKRDAWLINLVLEGYEDKWTTFQDIERLEGMGDNLDPDDDIAHGVLLEARCVAGLRVGAIEPVPALAASAIHHMRRAGSVAGLNYARFHMGLAETMRTRLRAAEATLRDAERTAVENYGQESTQTAIADVLLAQVQYLRNQTDAAAARIGPALEFIEDHDAWFDVFVSGYAVGASCAFLEGGLEAALKVLERGEATMRQRGLENLGPFLKGKRLRLMVRAGAIAEAAARARALDFPFRMGAWRERPHIWRSHHETGVALAHLSLAQGAPGQAREVLDDIKAAAEGGGRSLHLAEVLLLEAMTDRLAGNPEAAFEHLIGAIDIIMPDGGERLILDQGPPMEMLLRQTLRTQRDALSIRSLHQNIIADVVSQFEAARGAKTNGDAMSPREIEVLVELAQGYSNKQIARVLDMTENTVKFHLKNIYAKMGVEKRAQAVAEARARDLIL